MSDAEIVKILRHLLLSEVASDPEVHKALIEASLAVQQRARARKLIHKVHITIHDLPYEAYVKLRVEEERPHNDPDSTTRWKEIETDSSRITFFRNDPQKEEER